MILTHYFIKKKVEKQAAVLSGRKRKYCSLEEARRLLVFYQEKDKEVVEPCLEMLRQMKKQVVVCIYTSRTAAKPLPADYHILDCQKDVDIWGCPSDAKCKELKEINADILINLTGSDCYALQYILLQHDCPFKVGAKLGETDIHDLSISLTESDDVKYLFEQLLFYLQTIRSK